MKEIPLMLLARAATLKRLTNAGKAISSYLASAATRRRFLWGQPLILTVEPTNVCNLKCPLCVTGNGRMTRQAGRMSLERFKAILDELGESLWYLLLYHQGEPFINREFLQFVEYAKRKRVFVTTSTNAHYFDAETARRTIASRLDSVIVSVDGLDQETYETYRVGGSLAEVERGVTRLVKEKQQQRSRTPVIYLQFIVMRHNEEQAREMRAFARSLGADKCLLKTVQIETAEEARDWLPKSKSKRRYRFDDGQLRPRRLVKTPCQRPWTSALINWDGTVVPCCFDKNAAHHFGTVSPQQPFVDAWKSDQYDGFRDQMLTNRAALDICSNCSQGLRLFI